MKRVNVVGLIVPQGNKILVEKRKSNKKTSPCKIVIPGGHVERDEDLNEACRRELKEELNLKCNNFTFLGKKLYELSEEKQVIHYFVCESWEGKPRCLEADEILWISAEDLKKLDYKEERKIIRNYLKKHE